MALERSDRLIEAISNRDSLMKLRASHYHSIPGGYLFILFIHRYLVIYGRAKPSPIKGWLGALGGSRVRNVIRASLATALMIPFSSS